MALAPDLGPRYWEIRNTPAGSVSGELPAVPRVAVPPIPHPTCRDHCSDRHEHEADLACPVCGSVSYRLIAHEWAHNPGAWFYECVPVNDARALGRREIPACHRCGGPLDRVTPRRL